MPRARRILKWTGAITSSLIAAAWGFSLCSDVTASVYRRQRKLSLTVIAGGVAVMSEEPGLRYPWSLPHSDPLPAGVFWKFDQGFELIEWWPKSSRDPRCRWIFLPFWLPLTLLAVPTAFLFWTDRGRVSAGRCPKCCYDLSGLTPAAACPECGGHERSVTT